MIIYVTFGQDHYHEVNNKVFDKDTMCVIEAESHEEGRNLAFEHFGDKFFTTYEKKDWKERFNKFYPKGFIHLN